METLWRLHKCFFPCAPALAHTQGNFTRVNKPLLLPLTVFHVSACTTAAAIHSSSREIRSSEITPLMVNHTNDRLSKLAEQEACTVQIECVTGSKAQPEPTAAPAPEIWAYGTEHLPSPTKPPVVLFLSHSTQIPREQIKVSANYLKHSDLSLTVSSAANRT